MQRLFDLSSSYRSFFQLPRISKKKPIIGVCARDVKARSKPMRDILNRIIESEVDYEIIIFGDKVILDEEVEKWPVCDFLISFFSSGFPLDKAIKYVELRKPFCVNDLYLQKVLWDRRLVLGILEAVGVPTPQRLTVTRDNGPNLDLEYMEKLPLKAIEYIKSLKNNELKVIDQDTIEVDGVRLSKPFVEKPVDGENHNINIYYHSSQGGGTRKLFRKIANKSSEFFPNENELRMDGSFIYEKFIDVDNSEDIKVYTVGPEFAHAETRKSPVVDGLVRRNVDGKEMRYVTELSKIEKEIAKNVCLTFGQTICGLDLLRANGKSYVIDVNGWSFVKGNQEYYAKTAALFLEMFKNAEKRKYISHVTDVEPTFENVWTLKGFISVLRHADRTPKQKAKFKMTSKFIANWLNDSKEEVIIRKPENIKEFKESIKKAIEKEDGQEKTKLIQIDLILKKKGSLPGTKIQVKPSFNKINGILDSMQVIIKWGGEFTHAATHHSSDLGLNMRKDLTIINKNLLDDVKVYSSSERRVVATAESFIKPFLNLKEIDPNFIQVEKEMLDDSNDAKEQTDIVKAELKECMKLNSTSPLLSYFETPNGETPRELAEKIKESLIRLRDIMRDNLKKMNLSVLKEEKWCCNDNPQLFKERWEKLIKEYCDVEQSRFDPGKVCELYDSLKYDALHNRDFLEEVFCCEKDEYSLEPLKQLYRSAKLFFDMIAPREYGITNEEKLSIGMLTSRNLLTNILKDLLTIRDSTKPATILYFTKESHVHTLLNIVLNGGLPVNLRAHEIGELDYLTQITFELYECQKDDMDEKEFSLRLGFSPGAHHSFIMDLQMDEHHALSVASRINLTDHMDLDVAINNFNQLLSKDYRDIPDFTLENWESPINSPDNISPILSPSNYSVGSKGSTPSLLKDSS
ncbi:cortical actin cytoskeleton protein asp1 [Neoconidiobolus thromboides FSU 785]|nr:cortical actin cytoskeleton protein asp1 [Neoconidiobolus thromboides FSU 785]